MRKRKNGGGWRATLTLPTPARCRYRDIDDHDRWLNDWAADDYEPNSHGGDDSVVAA